jgi:hypothetical protein
VLLGIVASHTVLEVLARFADASRETHRGRYTGWARPAEGGPIPMGGCHLHTWLPYVAEIASAIFPRQVGKQDRVIFIMYGKTKGSGE